MNIAELLLPAVRWSDPAGFDDQRPFVDYAIQLGVGGFIIFGGPVEDVRTFTADVRQRSKTPLLIAADLERGAGQQFRGATGLPPLAAIGSLGEPDTVRRAAALTAREARSLGLNWIYAPVADIDLEPENPIIGTRSFGADTDSVARMVAAWVEGCQSEGVLACGKHFPGHGRTSADSHAGLPVVSATRAELEAAELKPFRAAIDAGVATMMTAHVAFPALDPSGAPATLSRAILSDLLRGELGFDGLIVTDALIMAGVRGGDNASGPEVRALRAGCDLLLYPQDLEVVARGIAAALESGELDHQAVEESLARRRRYAEHGASGARAVAVAASGPADGAAWAEALGCRVVHAVQGNPPKVPTDVRLTVVDDDVGGPFPPPSRDPFVAALRARGLTVRDGIAADGRLFQIVALFGDIRAWKGRPGYSASARDRVRAACTVAPDKTILIQFGHPRLAKTLGVSVPIVSAWGGEGAMQCAAANWLTEGC